MFIKPKILNISLIVPWVMILVYAILKENFPVDASHSVQTTVVTVYSFLEKGIIIFSIIFGIFVLFNSFRLDNLWYLLQIPVLYLCFQVMLLFKYGEMRFGNWYNDRRWIFLALLGAVISISIWFNFFFRKDRMKTHGN